MPTTLNIGKDARFATLDGHTEVNLGRTELRAIGRTIWQDSELMASGVIYESIRDIEIDQRSLC